MSDASILGLIVTFGFYLAWKMGIKTGRRDGVSGTLEQLEEQKIIHIDEKGDIKPGTSEKFFSKK